MLTTVIPRWRVLMNVEAVRLCREKSEKVAKFAGGQLIYMCVATTPWPKIIYPSIDPSVFLLIYRSVAGCYEPVLAISIAFSGSSRICLKALL